MEFKFTFIVVDDPAGPAITFSNGEVPEGMYDLVCSAAHTVGQIVTMKYPDGLASDMLMHGTINSETEQFTEVSVEPMPSKDTPKH